VDPVTHWFKVRAPILALLITLLGVAFSTYGRLTALEQQARDSASRQEMMEQTLARIETRLMVVR
jgi:hypothetical protein